MKANKSSDKRLEALVNRMFEKSLRSKHLNDTIGIAIECNRFDIMEKAISMSTRIGDTLQYCLRVCIILIYILIYIILIMRVNFYIFRLRKTKSNPVNRDKKFSDYLFNSI